MKKSFKITTKMAMALLLMFSMVSTGIFTPLASAAGQRYAYSVGVDHSPDTDLSGDFTGNVSYASTCYGMISGVTSYYQYNPTVNYLRSETNPNGVRKLASDIVFLNGHGNYDNMAFGDSRGSGVYYGSDLNYGDYKYAGLKSISTMNTVDFIAFVGCDTAVGTNNLASVANSKGATTSIGFTTEIHSRNTYGPEWLVEFHDYLTNGYTVQQSVNYATSEYPGSDLGTSIKIYGSTSNTITSGTRALNENENCDIIEVPLDGFQNCTAVPAENCDIIGFDNLIAEIESMYADFSPEDYKVTVNMYSEDGQNGLIALTYYVGDEIETDHAYIVSIENGVAIAITPSRSLRTGLATLSANDAISENDMLEAVAAFESQKASRSVPAPTSFDEESSMLRESDELVNTISRYYYDYTLNKLTYAETYIYKTSGPLSVYVDTQAVWDLS